MIRVQAFCSLSRVHTLPHPASRLLPRPVDGIDRLSLAQGLPVEGADHWEHVRLHQQHVVHQGESLVALLHPSKHLPQAGILRILSWLNILLFSRTYPHSLTIRWTNCHAQLESVIFIGGRRPAKQSTNLPPTNKQTNQLVSQPASQPARQPANQPTNQPINQPTNQPINQSINQSMNQSNQ